MFFVEKVFEIYELNSTLKKEERVKPFVFIYEELRNKKLKLS